MSNFMTTNFSLFIFPRYMWNELSLSILSPFLDISDQVVIILIFTRALMYSISKTSFINPRVSSLIFDTMKYKHSKKHLDYNTIE